MGENILHIETFFGVLLKSYFISDHCLGSPDKIQMPFILV